MKTTKTVAYALACIAELAKRMGEFVEVREVAQVQNIPAAYCQKILLALSRAGIVMSVKGQGFTLILPPEDLTTLRVLQALQETEKMDSRLRSPRLRLSEAGGNDNSESDENGSIKTIGDTLAAKMNSALASLTVAELLIASR